MYSGPPSLEGEGIVVPVRSTVDLRDNAGHHRGELGNIPDISQGVAGTRETRTAT